MSDWAQKFSAGMGSEFLPCQRRSSNLNAEKGRHVARRTPPLRLRVPKDAQVSALPPRCSPKHLFEHVRDGQRFGSPRTTRPRDKESTSCQTSRHGGKSLQHSSVQSRQTQADHKLLADFAGPELHCSRMVRAVRTVGWCVGWEKIINNNGNNDK